MIMIRFYSTTTLLLIASIIVSCAQTSLSTLEPTSTVSFTSMSTPIDTPINSPDVTSTPIIGSVNGVIKFAGRLWNVKSGCGLGPGPNCWSDSAESVWVQDGELHLKIRKIEDKWYSAEVTAAECTQYGTHRFFVSSDLNSLDKNVVAAVFLYKDDQNEIDMEFSRWTDENAGENAQFVVQPWDIPGNIHRFAIPQDITESTHVINWNSSSVQFQSIRGHYQEPPPSENLLDKWEYMGNSIPKENDCLRVHINLWQIGGNPPSNNQEAVFIVSNAQLPDPYQPPPTPIPPTPLPTTGSEGAPSIKVTEANIDLVSGLVMPGAYCNDNYRVVIYAKTDIWYVQPYIDDPLTIIDPISCNWESSTHPWNKLAVFLVPKNYDLPAILSSQSCPPDLPSSEVVASFCYSP